MIFSSNWLGWVVLSSCIFMIMMFLFSKSSVANLFILFVYTMSVCLLLYLYLKNFWFEGLLMIVMLTGLFLVFTYISSITPETPDKSFPLIYMFLSLGCTTIMSMAGWLWSLKVEQPSFKNMVSYINFQCLNSWVGLLLISLLLVLVVSFVRLTLSKGGSIRKLF